MAAALERIISGDYRSRADLPAGAEKNLLSWLDKIDREGRQWRDAEDMDHWEQYINQYHGGRVGPRAPKFRANVIRPVIDRRNALLTENKPQCKILPWRDGLGQAAEILEKLFDAEWHATDMQGRIEDIVQLSSVLGAAGIDTAWNPSARHGEGAFDPVVIDPRQVGFDPYIRKSRDIDKATYVWVETVRNLFDIQRDYPGRGMLVKADRSVSSINTGAIQTNANNSVVQQINQSFQSRMKRLEDGPIPRKICREYWLKDPTIKGTGELKFPLGRNIERGGDVILDDKGNPYWDGGWPIVWYDGKQNIDSIWGKSEVGALQFIANSISRIGNLFVENSILGGNLVVITDADAITNETRNKLTNAAGLIIPKKFGRNLEYRPPLPMPPHMLQFITWALGLIDYLVGMRDGQIEGKGRVELRSGVQLEGLQQAAQVLIRAAARRIESFLERLGDKWVSRVFQFYTGKRLMYYLGEKNDYQQWTFNYGDLQDVFLKVAQSDGATDTDKEGALREAMRGAWRQFAFKISPFSSLAANKIARGQMLMQMAEMGMMPASKVMTELGFDNAKELRQEAQAEAMQFGPLNPPSNKGKGKK
jgi:hypothetical protein